MFSPASVCTVCQLTGSLKTTEPIFTKFGEKVVHEPRKKRIDLGDNPDLGPDLGIFLKEMFLLRYWPCQW